MRAEGSPEAARTPRPPATARTPWRVHPLEEAEPAELVTGSLRLLEGLERHPVPTLRWYRATAPAIVLGRGQSAVAASGLGDIPVLGRFSGGGAVLLDPDLLSLDVALPAGHRWLRGELGAVFDYVGRAWASGLDALGVPDLRLHLGPATARRQGGPRERLLAAVCFATLGRGEVLSGERKLVGMAQRRRRQGALVQCGLLRRWRPARLLRALGADPDDAEISAAAVGLEDLVAPAPDDRAVIEAVSAIMTEQTERERR